MSSVVKARDVAAYILSKSGESIDRTRLHMLLYYCQGWHLAWDKEPLFEEKIKAWIISPIVVELWLCEFRDYEASDFYDGDLEALSSSQKDSIDAVLLEYGDKSSQELKDSIHNGKPWFETRRSLGSERGDVEITHELMIEYFSRLAIKHENTVKYFFDTEFIEDGETIELISIGIVAEDGREYYACNSECDLQRADDWVKKNVVSLLPEKFDKVWKTRDEIKNDILKFTDSGVKPEFWAYFADYDWVVFCQLFGRMIDLPDHFPKYCMDLKQLMRENGISRDHLNHLEQGSEHNALDDAKWVKEAYNYVNDEGKWGHMEGAM
jgi:uncharacterized phage-associated protein